MGLSECQFGTRHIRNCKIEREKSTAVVSVRHFATSLSISAGHEREKARERSMPEFISIISHMMSFYSHMQMRRPSKFPFIFLTLLNSSLKRFYSRGVSLCAVRHDILYPTAVRPYGASSGHNMESV